MVTVVEVIEVVVAVRVDTGDNGDHGAGREGDSRRGGSDGGSAVPLFISLQ